MQGTLQKFRQSSIVFEKPGILSKNLKTLTGSNYPTVQYFLLNRLLTLLSRKRVQKFSKKFFKRKNLVSWK